jgi:CubicO group peptidase (beta-lactamase class C family)
MNPRSRASFPRRMFAALCLGLGLVGGAEAAEKTASAPPAPANLGEFRQRAQSLMTDAHIPGAGMVLVRDGKPIWVGGLGLADKASGRKVDADTAFRIGSISKSFLAIAILRQVERGTMHLDDKLSDIAPEIAIDNPWEATDPVRVVHVLEHTAGFDDMHFRHMRPDPAAHGTLQQMRLFAPEFHVRWRPGERMSYSNPGYGLAAYLLEKTTGRRAQDVIDDEVLRPLGMTHTVWERGKAGPRLASGYSPDGTRTQAWEELSMPAVGGLISTPSDMAKYLAFYMSSGASAPGILTQRSLLRMETSGTALSARSGLAAGYGIGNVENERDGWRVRGHSGGIRLRIQFRLQPQGELRLRGDAQQHARESRGPTPGPDGAVHRARPSAADEGACHRAERAVGGLVSHRESAQRAARRLRRSRERGPRACRRRPLSTRASAGAGHGHVRIAPGQPDAG